MPNTENTDFLILVILKMIRGCSLKSSLAGPDGFRLQESEETVWSQLQGVGGSPQEFVRSSL